MSRKKKHDEPELEPAADAPAAAGNAAAQPAGAADAGPAGGGAAGTAAEPEAAGDALQAAAEDGGQVSGTPDPVADAIDAEDDEEAATQEGTLTFEGETLEDDHGQEGRQGDDGEPQSATQGQRDPDGQEPPAADGAAPGMGAEPDGGAGAAGAADDGGNAEGDPDAELTPAGVEPNVLAALMAASLAFGTDGEAPTVDGNWLCASGAEAGHRATRAAAFLRGAPGAVAETLVIHLRMSGFRDTPDADGRIAVAWRVFAATLEALDAHDRELAEVKRRALAAAEAARGPRGVPRARLSNQPRATLTDTGRALQRKR